MGQRRHPLALAYGFLLTGVGSIFMLCTMALGEGYAQLRIALSSFANLAPCGQRANLPKRFSFPGSTTPDSYFKPAESPLSVWPFLSFWPFAPKLSQSTSVTLSPVTLSPTALNAYAQTLTVGILAPDFMGSGTLVACQKIEAEEGEGVRYTVVTNAHVLRNAAPPLQVLTHDRKVHRARLIWQGLPAQLDLAILQVEILASSASPLPSYPIAHLFPPQPQPLSPGLPIVAAGRVDAGETGFRFMPGQLTYDLSQPLERGYQRGYSSLVERGMSGGPVLEATTGTLLGVNTIKANPLWDVYTYFEDGTDPPEALQQAIPQSSWAVPSDRFLPLVLPFGAQVALSASALPPPQKD